MHHSTLQPGIIIEKANGTEDVAMESRFSATDAASRTSLSKAQAQARYG